MGFGYLFLGYLCTFLLKVTADIKPVGAGPLAVLLGGILMAVGIWKLSDYEKSFRLSFLPLGLLLLFNCYRLIAMIGAWTGATPDWMTATFNSVVDWLDFAAILLVHAFLFPAIMRLALAVELRKTANAAIRDLIFTGLWGILYLICVLVPMSQTLKNAFFRAQILVNVVVILFNLVLLLSCMKNIAPEEDEAGQAPRRYRWNFLNRVGDRFFSEHERAAEKKREETEVFLRRRKEKRETRKKDEK